MATLEQRVNEFATQVGTDINGILANIGDLTALSTTDKTSLVNAINEIVNGTPSGVLLASNNLSDILDAAVARTNLNVTSSADVTTEIATAIAGQTLASLGGLSEAQVDARVQLLVDSAPAALDTLNELAAALGDDPNFAATITAGLNNKVAYDVAQTKTVAEKLQACTNLGIGDPDATFLITYTTARDA